MAYLQINKNNTELFLQWMPCHGNLRV